MLNYRNRYETLLIEAQRVLSVVYKTIGGTVKTYTNELDNIVYDAFNHRISSVDMRRAHKALLEQLAPEVMTEGLHEGGLKDDDIDEEDQAWIDEAINDWLGTQLESINGFAKDAYAAGDDKDLRQAILAREVLWSESLRTLGEMGRAYALKSERGQWELGEADHHTPDCVKLAQGKPHRLQWFLDRDYIPGQIHIGCKCKIRSVRTNEIIMGG